MISGVFRLTMPLSPKASFGLPVFASTRIQLAVARTENDLRRRLRVAGPVFDAARRRRAGGKVKGPDFLSRAVDPARPRANTAWTYTSFHRSTSGVFSLGLKPDPPRPRPPPNCGPSGASPTPATGPRLGAGAVAAGRFHVIDPRHLEPRDIRRRDLRQRRKAHAAGIVAVGWPFRRRL